MTHEAFSLRLGRLGAGEKQAAQICSSFSVLPFHPFIRMNERVISKQHPDFDGKSCGKKWYKKTKMKENPLQQLIGQCNSFKNSIADACVFSTSNTYTRTTARTHFVFTHIQCLQYFQFNEIILIWSTREANFQLIFIHIILYLFKLTSKSIIGYYIFLLY